MANGLESRMERFSSGFDVVTGAFGYTGRHIAKGLLNAGRGVRTITRYPERSYVLDEIVPILPYFDKLDELAYAMMGVDTVYNTHWTRFDRGNSSFEKALANTGALLKAAERAGARKFVHISVSNADRPQHFPYFAKKHTVERMVEDSGLSYAILRPALIFGPEEILINNIDYFLRHFRVFAIPGDGDYRLQPIHVDDLASMAIEASQTDKNLKMNVAGPRDYSFNELIEVLKETHGIRARTPHVNPKIALFCARMIGYAYRDEVLTRDEMYSLMEGLLESENPVRGPTDFRSWLAQNRHLMGANYAHELRRHYTKS